MLSLHFLTIPKPLNTFNSILNRCQAKEKMFAILVDPDKYDAPKDLQELIYNLKLALPDIILIGGSLINNGNFELVINELSSLKIAPIILFPGNNKQVSSNADAILLLSLISGRNAELLIGQHVVSAFDIKNANLEVIPTGYMLIESGPATSAQYMSNTQPIPYNKPDIAIATALAGEQLGLKFIYMDGGSGAQTPISKEMIKGVRQTVNTPLIIGGGIRNKEQAIAAWNSGADIIVIGNAIEKNPTLALEISLLRTVNK